MSTYGKGTLAYYDSMQGLVPVKVTAVRIDRDTGQTEVTALVTGRCLPQGWKTGETVSNSPTWIVPRPHVRRRRYGSMILGGYQWI